jgi:hypothetical protein
MSGQLPDGLQLDPTEGTISGSATLAGHYPFKLQVQDSSVRPDSAQADLAIDIKQSGAQPPVCGGSGCYGPGIGANGLANTTIGPYGNEASYRFRAQHSGSLSQLRLYLLPDKPGYSAGTAGTLQIAVMGDDGSSAHNPSGKALAVYEMSSPLTATPSKYFPVVTFPSPAVLSEGQLYHIVFTNTDANPSVNYLSIDGLYVDPPPSPVQPAYSDVDSAVLLSTGGGAWSPRKGFTPIMELIYQDGWSSGIGYMEGWIGAPQNISGSSAVRETFVVGGGPKTVGMVGVRVARIAGADDLQVRLEADDGTTIEQGEIPASAFQLADSPSSVWATYTFSVNHTLTPGREYHLVLQTASTSSYQTFPIRKGADYGFGQSTFFPDGFAQFNQGGDWVGWTQWGVSNRTDSDLQFYFGLAP